MAPAFWAAAISRQDGSGADGIHLLWTAPPAAGHSVHGYDVQRRVSRFKPKVTCHTLSSAELDALHRDFRLITPVAAIAVARARCPSWAGPIPDEPIDPDGRGPQVQCVDFGRERFPGAPRGEFGPLRARLTSPASPTGVPPGLKTTGPFRGLDCGTRLEITLPLPAMRVEATLVHFAQAATVTALDAAGTVVGSATMTTGQKQPETVIVGGAGIVSVAIDAPKDETLLLRFCFVTERKPEGWCVDFGERKQGRDHNPLRTLIASCLAVGEHKTPQRFTEIRRMGTFTGLDCAREMRITLTRPAPAVRLTVVTAAPDVVVRATQDDGSPAGDAVVRVRGAPQVLRFAGRRIAEVVILAPKDETLVLDLCVASRREVDAILKVSASARRAAAMPGGPGATPSTGGTAASLAVLLPGGESCRRYRLGLDGAHQFVQVVANAAAMLAIARREGKAVDSRWSVTPGGVQDVRFERRSVDEVLLYTPRPLSGLRVCVDALQAPADEEREWSSVPYIAKGLQLPLRQLDPTLLTVGDELALARSRLLAGENIDAAAFGELSQTMNEAVAAGPFSPAFHTAVVRDAVDDPFIEMRPWPTSLAVLVDAAWRRALGFGYLDNGGGLTAGATYDYRISADFRRRDLEEELLGFHTVPVGTTLPPSCHLGRVHLSLPGPRTVQLYPAAPASATRHTGRKGLTLAPRSSGGRCITLSFDQPVRQVVLEIEPALSSGLTYEAKTTGFVLGIGTSITMTGSVPARDRATITFASPVDSVTLRGSGLLYGVRFPFSTAGDPKDPVRVSVVVPAVRYEPTAPPAPPPALGTTNLQQPLAPGEPAVTLEQKPQAIGFRLHWEPPGSGGGAGTPWPPDLGAVPPTDVLGYHLERRRVDVGGSFQDVSGAPTPTLFFGNRRGTPRTRVMTWGADVLEVFPEVPEPEPPVEPFVTADDVLLGPGLTGGEPPGSVHQYRVYSVDAIGRRSATPALGSEVRLEKRVAPPQPPGPPPATPPRPEPLGVRARVIQKSDPDLTPDDVTLLGTSTNAVVLEWGWTAEERARDPLATEFRVYWQPLPPDTVRGTLAGPATLVGGMWETTAALDQAIAADSMKGQYLRAPSYPFKVASNTAGQTVTVRLEPSALQPLLAPGAAAVVFHPMLDGTELRPSRWAERTAVVPITAADPQPFVFRDRLTIDAGAPRVRVWVGVSAADAQSYVADELPATALNGGRPGNESSIAPAIAEAHYIGRPTFVPPPPLAAIPELVSPEPLGDTISVTIDLPALLPAVVVPAGHRVIVDRIPAGLLTSAMSRASGGAIGVQFPDGTTTTYTLANPGDQAALLAEIATGEPARVEGRFVADLVMRFPARFEPLWGPALTGPVPFAPVSTPLPSTAERYLYRIRISDPAGHVSATWALVPRVVRVVSTRTPGPPRLDMSKSATDTLTVTGRVVNAYDIRWLLLFSLATDLLDGPAGRTQESATLLRLPDRRDLYPNDGLRLRLADGTLLPPTIVDLQASGTPSPPDVVASAQLVQGYEKSVAVWGVAMTRDGIPSRLAGPVTASTGPQPLVVPALAVTISGSIDTATWGVPTIPVEVSLERSADGGATWTRVSPWLPSSTTTFVLPGAGARQYRLALRRSGQYLAGSPVTPA